MTKSANQDSDGPAKDGPSSAPKGRRAAIARAGRLGRRVALGIYWLGLVYMLVVGFATVIPQVFWPTTPLEAPADVACSDALVELKDQLLAEGEAHVGRAGERTHRVVESRLEDFFRNWDDELVALAGQCEEAAGYAELRRLRYRYETTLRRFDREDGVLIQRANAALHIE